MTEFRDGIYLEVKQGKIGTGNTSSNVVYKNFYAVKTAGEKLELYLLDDDLALTGLKEKDSAESVLKRMTHQKQHQNHFASLFAESEPKKQEKALAQRPKASLPETREKPKPPEIRQKAATPAEQKDDPAWWDVTSKKF